MNKKRIAIAGCGGFIGSHVAEVCRKNCHVIPIPADLWQNTAGLAGLLRDCDGVIMLAGMSRCNDGELLYRTNMELVQKLADALPGNGLRVVFCSTTHENKDTPYHASKRDGSELLTRAACEKGDEPVTVLMPNTFGARGKPFYNSVVSTFCWQAAHGEKMTVSPDAGETLLIDVKSLVEQLYLLAAGVYPGKRIIIAHRFAVPVARIAELLNGFANGEDFDREDDFSRLLHETFESYKNDEK